jgi:hypothetical protein
VRRAIAFVVLASAVAWPAAALSAVTLGTAPSTTSAELGCVPGRPGVLLVAYTRTGGFVGIRERLRVYRGGQADLVRGAGQLREFRLTCRRVRVLRDALRNARFATLQPVYAPEPPVADGLVESVSYAGRTVRVLTGADPPPRLERVLALLRDIVGRRR